MESKENKFEQSSSNFCYKKPKLEKVFYNKIKEPNSDIAFYNKSEAISHDKEIKSFYISKSRESLKTIKKIGIIGFIILVLCLVLFITLKFGGD